MKHLPSGQFNAGRTNRTLHYRTVLITWTGTCSGQRLIMTHSDDDGVFRFCNVFYQEVYRRRSYDKNNPHLPKPKTGLTAMFVQPCQHGHLPLNPETLTTKNKTVTISGDPSKRPNDNTKTKLKNNSTTTMQEACGRASTTSQALKGINQLL